MTEEIAGRTKLLLSSTLQNHENSLWNGLISVKRWKIFFCNCIEVASNPIVPGAYTSTRNE